MNSTSRVMVTPALSVRITSLRRWSFMGRVCSSLAPARSVSSLMVSIAAARRGSLRSPKGVDPLTAIVGVCVATRSAKLVAICDPHVDEQLAEETNGWFERHVFARTHVHAHLLIDARLNNRR